VGYLWLREARLFEEDRLSKVKAGVLSTKGFHSARGNRKAQGGHNLEMWKSQGLMTALALECSKWAREVVQMMMTVKGPQRKRGARFQMAAAQIQMVMKCPN
jgi:hypothetical protein